MPFNSTTYFANKCRKDAWKRIAEAKDIKARFTAGNAYDWELRRIPLIVAIARSSMRLYLINQPEPRR